MIETFTETATELFKEAGVPIDESTKSDFDETILILANKMAELSFKYGLSFERLDKYEAQKKALVEDLKKKYGH